VTSVERLERAVQEFKEAARGVDPEIVEAAVKRVQARAEESPHAKTIRVLKARIRENERADHLAAMHQRFLAGIAVARTRTSHGPPRIRTRESRGQRPVRTRGSRRSSASASRAGPSDPSDSDSPPRVARGLVRRCGARHRRGVR
jgi:hypothetical protein